MEDAAAPPDMKLNGAPPGVAGNAPPTDVAPESAFASIALARDSAFCNKAGVEVTAAFSPG